MGRWLTVAERLFRRQAVRPAPFEVQCVCGGRVSGERTAVHQTPLCPRCRKSLFVLPACVYPVPKAPRTAQPPAPRKKKPAATQSAPAEQKRDSTRGPREPTAPALEFSSERPLATKPRPPAREVVRATLTASVGALKTLRKKQATPVRLVLASALGVAMLTGWWVVHRRAVNEAERIVPVAARLGEQALEEHDLGEAARQFQKVRAALDLLGRDDPQARILRQSAQEIGASAHLAAAGLFDILHEAASTGPGGSWSETFRSSYRGGWVVIDAPVARSADASFRHKFDVDLPISDGEARAVVVAELPLFERLLPVGSEPRRLIFAAQLDACRPDPGEEGAWQIVMQPGTAFLWSTPENLARLGVVLDDDTNRVLSDQAERLGVSP